MGMPFVMLERDGGMAPRNTACSRYQKAGKGLAHGGGA